MYWISALEALGLASCRNAKGSAPPSHRDVRFDDWSATFCLFCRTPGALLVIPELEGPLDITYLKTPWSGIVEFHEGEQSLVVDAYAEQHQREHVQLRGEQKRSISLRLLDSRNAAAKSGEFWLSGLDLQSRPQWRPRHQRVTPLLDLAHSDVGELLVLRNDNGVSRVINEYGVWG